MVFAAAAAAAPAIADAFVGAVVAAVGAAFAVVELTHADADRPSAAAPLLSFQPVQFPGVFE